MVCIFDFFYLRIDATIMNWKKWNIREVKQTPKSMMETLRMLRSARYHVG